MNKAKENFCLIKGIELNLGLLSKINNYALTELSADDVYVFKVIICDNGTDDRNFEPFNLKALNDMKELYIGKTVIKNHSIRDVDTQCARVFDTELISDGSTTELGEPFTKLVAYCYMVKTESNADLIKEIDAGIKKEVSTDTAPEKYVCSICGVDNMANCCPHFWGKTYAVNGEDKICYFIIDGVKEAYELSFVTVPAQKRAGTIKSAEDIEAKKTAEAEKKKSAEENEKAEKEKELIIAKAKIKISQNQIFLKKLKEKENDEKNA